jgi:adenylate cyclase
MFELTYQVSDAPIRVRLADGETLVGRAPECDVVLPHPTVSRQHARLQVRNGRCVLRDAGSRLGTYRNGELITSAEIAAGDVLRFGQLRIDVRAAPVDGVALSDGHAHVSEASVPMPEVSRPLPGAVPLGGVTMERPSPAAPGLHVDAQLLLAALADIGAELVRSVSLSDILDRVVALTFELTGAERVFVVLTDEASGELVPRVARHRDGSTPQGASLSRTIARIVMTDHVALLASDTLIDARLEHSDSIASQQIRSCMCAPLWNQTEVIGIVYVDSPQSERLTSAHLNLFTALTNYAAVAIEQARLSTRLLEETRRRQRLERYHSPRVVDRILEAGDDAGLGFVVQEREITVLFADVVGFTGIAERLGPIAAAALLNGFFGVMTEVLFEHEGTLDKFIGDAILATFGAPLTQPDHAQRALRSAVEMRRALHRFNQASGGPPLQMRIGVNSGEALVGDIGAPRRREFTVLGDVVNVASRLESEIAKPGQIVVGGATHRLAGPGVAATHLGSFTLRGRSEPVDAYLV